MKLKFKQQDYQTEATSAVIDLFAGQEKNTSTFTITHETQMNLLQNDFGIGNAMLIDENTLKSNLNNIQKRYSLPLTDDADDKRFCVEMETGTGKTYVYTKTILELNRKYGFTKFIIVVPSVAIREGVYKSLEITKSISGFCMIMCLTVILSIILQSLVTFANLQLQAILKL